MNERAVSALKTETNDRFLGCRLCTTAPERAKVFITLINIAPFSRCSRGFSACDAPEQKKPARDENEVIGESLTHLYTMDMTNKLRGRLSNRRTAMGAFTEWTRVEWPRTSLLEGRKILMSALVLNSLAVYTHTHIYTCQCSSVYWRVNHRHLQPKEFEAGWEADFAKTFRISPAFLCLVSFNHGHFFGKPCWQYIVYT